VPDVALTLLHVGLAQGEGRELHLPGRSCLQPLHQVLVGIAGKRAAIVPGHRETGSHAPCEPRGRGRDSRDRARGNRLRPTRPSTIPTAIPPRTSEAWWM